MSDPLGAAMSFEEAAAVVRNAMTDQPVTPDREALIRALGASMLDPVMGPNGHTQPLVDALLPLLIDALDRARQQGRAEGGCCACPHA